MTGASERRRRERHDDRPLGHRRRGRRRRRSAAASLGASSGARRPTAAACWSRRRAGGRARTRCGRGRRRAPRRARGVARAGDVALDQARLHEVRELAQAHRAGHARAALERVQRAAQLGRPACRRADCAAMRAAPRRPAGTARPLRRGRSAAPARRRRRGSSPADRPAPGSRLDLVVAGAARLASRRADRRRSRAARALRHARRERRAGASAGSGCRRRLGVLFVEAAASCGRGLGVLRLARGLLAQLVQLAPGSAHASVWSPAVNASRALTRCTNWRSARDRARQHRLRVAGQRRAALRERQQRLLERPSPSPRPAESRRCDGCRTACGSARIIAARRHRARIELQDREFVLERGEMLVAPRRTGSSTATCETSTSPIVISSGSGGGDGCASARPPRPASATARRTRLGRTARRRPASAPAP